MSKSLDLDFDEPHSDFDFDEPMWPTEVFYSTARGVNNSMHAITFLNARPDRLIVSAGEVFTLGNFNVWHQMTDDELRSEIRATNPNADILDFHDVSDMVREIKILRMTSARQFQWIDEPPNAPSTGRPDSVRKRNSKRRNHGAARTDW